jgi:hypothetical protein
MKYIYSLFLLAVVGLLVKDISSPKQPLYNVSEMREINRRLRSIGAL